MSIALVACLVNNMDRVHANEKEIYVNNSPIIDDKSVINEEASKEVVNVITSNGTVRKRCRNDIV